MSASNPARHATPKPTTAPPVAVPRHVTAAWPRP